jgi:hypothetical protein
VTLWRIASGCVEIDLLRVDLICTTLHLNPQRNLSRFNDKLEIQMSRSTDPEMFRLNFESAHTDTGGIASRPSD